MTDTTAGIPASQPQGFLDQPGFADSVRSVLTDLLALPPSLMDYMVQYQALNGLPIPVTQLSGFTQFTPTIATPVSTAESTASTTYTDLTTPGPTLSNLPDGKYLVIYSAIPTGASGAGWTSLSINGAAASDSGTWSLLNRTFINGVAETLKNNNSNTITMKYRCDVSGGGASITWASRWMAALRYANA